MLRWRARKAFATALAICEAAFGLVADAPMRMMLAAGSTAAWTLPASVSAVSPGRFRAAAASTPRVVSSVWIVASCRSASADAVTPGPSSSRTVAFAV